jgi:hypothetical protein
MVTSVMTVVDVRLKMFQIAHSILFAIVYCMETSVDLVFRSSAGQLYNNKNINRKCS